LATYYSQNYASIIGASLARKGYYVVDGILYYEGTEVGDHRCIVALRDRSYLTSTTICLLQDVLLQRNGAMNQAVLLLEWT